MRRFFRHYKGNLYEYLGECTHSETLEEMVIYQAQYGDKKVWVRPKPMFFEEVHLPDGSTVPRFMEVTQSRHELVNEAARLARILFDRHYESADFWIGDLDDLVPNDFIMDEIEKNLEKKLQEDALVRLYNEVYDQMLVLEQ